MFAIGVVIGGILGIVVVVIVIVKVFKIPFFNE